MANLTVLTSKHSETNLIDSDKPLHREFVAAVIPVLSNDLCAIYIIITGTS